MAHQCEDCGASFETLSGLRLHDCSDIQGGADDGGAALDLDAPVDAAASGDVSALHRAVATYEAELATAIDRGDGGTAYRELFWDYYEPLADGLDAAATERGWSVLAEFVDAYDPETDEDVPLCSPVVENAVGRFVVRSRLTEGVEAIPTAALAYLLAIPRNTETDVPREESFAYGWGIDHPDHAVADRIYEMAHDEYFWASAALEQAFYADQEAAVSLLERLVTAEDVEFTVTHPDGDVTSARFFLDAVAGVEYGLDGRLPRYWDWQTELDYTFEWEESVRQRIRQLVAETGVDASVPEDWSFTDLGL